MNTLNRLYRQQRQKQRETNLPELIKPQQGRTEIELENIMRWEDDGGQISGRNRPVDRSDHPAATRANKIMRVSNTTHIDTFNEKSEKQAYQVYKDEYLVNDSLGG